MNYEKAKENAKTLYMQIGKIWCPALESFISFDDNGFHHLIWKNRKHRSKSDQSRRFLFLPHAQNILASTKIDITYQARDIISPRNRHGEIEAVSFSAAYWAFTKKLSGKTVTVIVHKVGNGEKHFYSIFDK